MGLTIQLLSSASIGASTPSPATVNVATGLPGPAGTSATIAIGAVTSVPFGTAPTVTNVGTSTNAIFNFQLETGQQGIQGIQGQQGIQGVKGDTGATGAGVVTGGTAGQVLAKIDGTNYNTHWINIPVTSVAGKTGAVTLTTTDISGMSSYLTTTSASATYQTIAGMSAYLTISSASSTYQTISGMSAYLTTSSASATYLTKGDAANRYLAGQSGTPTGSAGSATIYPATGAFDYAQYFGNGAKFYVNDAYKYGIDQNGVKFSDGTVQTSAGVAFAPNDGNYYIQQSGNWIQLIVS